MTETEREKLTLRELLAEPFKPHVVGWKPQMVKNNRALATVYIDARDVENRLDEVLGVCGWQDEYHLLPDGNVLCKLSIKPAGNVNWTTKSDVGGPSDQPDHGDRMKAAFSDALKRAAVKFGIGRYLYAIDVGWVDYDPVKKAIVNRPELPWWALPYDMRPADKRPGYNGKAGAATVASPPAVPPPAPQKTAEVKKAEEFIDKHKKEEPQKTEPKAGPPKGVDIVKWLDERIDEIETPAHMTAVVNDLHKVDDKLKKKALYDKIVELKGDKGWKYDAKKGEFYSDEPPLVDALTHQGDEDDVEYFDDEPKADAPEPAKPEPAKRSAPKKGKGK